MKNVAQQRKRQLEWYHRNKETSNAYHRKWKERNCDLVREADRYWKMNHLDYVYAAHRGHRKTNVALYRFRDHLYHMFGTTSVGPEQIRAALTIRLFKMTQARWISRSDARELFVGIQNEVQPIDVINRIYGKELYNVTPWEKPGTPQENAEQTEING